MLQKDLDRLKNLEFELQEKNKRVQQLEEMVSQKNEQLAEYRDKSKSVEHFLMWNMGYIIELIGFRNRAILIAKDNNIGDVKDFLKMKFPMLQTTTYHQLYKNLSSYLQESDYDLKTGEVCKYLHNKYLEK